MGNQLPREHKVLACKSCISLFGKLDYEYLFRLYYHYLKRWLLSSPIPLLEDDDLGGLEFRCATRIRPLAKSTLVAAYPNLSEDLGTVDDFARGD